jgi:hypothetical protein
MHEVQGVLCDFCFQEAVYDELCCVAMKVHIVRGAHFMSKSR